MDKIIKINEIDRVYSEKLMELLSKGLRVYSNANGGTQGEMCKMRLTDGKDVYSLLMYSHNMSNNIDRIRVVSIKLEKFKDNYRNDLFDQTLWNDSGEEIYSINFYEIGKSYRGIFVKTIEEWKEWNNIQEERFDRKFVRESFVLNFDTDKILSIVRRHKGYKTLKKDLLGNVIKSKRGYEIGIKGDKKNICINYIR